MTETILFQTLVGSHMWSMVTPESDVDLMTVYRQDTKEILSGYRVQKGKEHRMFVKDHIDYDIQYMEIGHLVELLMQGNVNALWTVTSPYAIKKSESLISLRSIVMNTLSRKSYHSIVGMATSQMNDEKKRPSMAGKGFRTALRTINFGIALFDRGCVEFKPVKEIVTLDEVKNGFIELKVSCNHSKLPSSTNIKMFREYLCNERIRGLFDETK